MSAYYQANINILIIRSMLNRWLLSRQNGAVLIETQYIHGDEYIFIIHVGSQVASQQLFYSIFNACWNNPS